MKRITATKLLRASQALLALTDCDDADDVFYEHRDKVVDEMTEIAGGYSSAILAEERDMPHSIDLVRLAHHFAVIAVPDVD